MNTINYSSNNQAIFFPKSIQSSSYFQGRTQSQSITMDTLSNNSNHKLSDFSNFNNYNNYPYTRHRNSVPNPKNKKRVKFNEVVDVTIVKSYKKYNKCEKELTLDELIDNKCKSKRKNAKNCECIII